MFNQIKDRLKQKLPLSILMVLIKGQNNLIRFKELLFLFLFNIDKRPQYEGIHSQYKTISNKENTEIKKINKGKEKVIFINDWNHEIGIVDRLNGILTTYHLAKQNKRPFYIVWQQPFELTKYLEPSDLDWRKNPKDVSFIRDEAFAGIMMSDSKSKFFHPIEKFVFKRWFKIKKEFHVNTNCYLYPEKYSKLFKELFKPTKYLEEAVNKNLPASPYYSYSFRFMQLLGDFKDTYGDILNEEEREHMINRCLQELFYLLKSLPEGYLALVASDSKTFLKRACEADPRIFCIEGEIIHPHTYFQDPIDNPDIYLKTFLDFFLISKAEKVYRLQTGKMHTTGFPKLAAYIGNKPFIVHRF